MLATYCCYRHVSIIRTGITQFFSIADTVSDDGVRFRLSQCFHNLNSLETSDFVGDRPVWLIETYLYHYSGIPPPLLVPPPTYHGNSASVGVLFGSPLSISLPIIGWSRCLRCPRMKMRTRNFQTLAPLLQPKWFGICMMSVLLLSIARQNEQGPVIPCFLDAFNIEWSTSGFGLVLDALSSKSKQPPKQCFFFSRNTA